jgi:hypothetical protein
LRLPFFSWTRFTIAGLATGVYSSPLSEISDPGGSVVSDASGAAVPAAVEGSAKDATPVEVVLGGALAVAVVPGTVVEDVGFALGGASEGFVAFGTVVVEVPSGRSDASAGGVGVVLGGASFAWDTPEPPGGAVRDNTGWA